MSEVGIAEIFNESGLATASRIEKRRENSRMRSIALDIETGLNRLMVASNNERLVERRVTNQFAVRENKKRVGSNISEYTAVIEYFKR